MMPLYPAPMTTTLNGRSSSMHALLRAKPDWPFLILLRGTPAAPASPNSRDSSSSLVGEKGPWRLSELIGEMGLSRLSGFEVSIPRPFSRSASGKGGTCSIALSKIVWIPGGIAQNGAINRGARHSNVSRFIYYQTTRETNRADARTQKTASCGITSWRCERAKPLRCVRLALLTGRIVTGSFTKTRVSTHIRSSIFREHVQ